MNLLAYRTYGASNNSDLTTYAFIGIPVGLFILYTGFKEWNKFKKVADTPTSKVRSMAAGLVELNGKVATIKKLVSPITKHDCVYYKVEHQIYVRSKNGGSWVTTSVKTDFQNFYLQDETGKVEVDPRQAELDIPSDYITPQLYMNGSQRDIEYFLAPGDAVYTLGTAKNKPGVKTAKNEENFIITKGDSDPFYYITDKKEKDVQASLSHGAEWQVGIGAVVFLASLAYLVYSFMGL